jgi:hypothetical protein
VSDRPGHNHPLDSICLVIACPRGAWDAAKNDHSDHEAGDPSCPYLTPTEDATLDVERLADWMMEPQNIVRYNRWMRTGWGEAMRDEAAVIARDMLSAARSAPITESDVDDVDDMRRARNPDQAYFGGD